MKITLVKGIGFIINLVWTGGGGGERVQWKDSHPILFVVNSLLLDFVQVSGWKSQSEKARDKEKRKHCLMS